ncbi:hypothetical protein, partial [Bradyrhizobium sp. NAS80.1]|uniref:hypothetical protein n=1 Tax=Bradyrhizobium sp. NAS80.1 TaxID=1680159 RepID=UPI001160E4FB
MPAALRDFDPADVAFGSWLCENAKALERDRRSYSSKAVLALKLARRFNLDDELKNVILAVSRSFAFLHSQGHSRPTLRVSAAVRCLLFSETDQLTARQRNDAKGNTGLLHRSSCVLFEHLVGLTRRAGDEIRRRRRFIFPARAGRTHSARQVFIASTPVLMVGSGTGANKRADFTRYWQLYLATPQAMRAPPPP